MSKTFTSLRKTKETNSNYNMKCMIVDHINNVYEDYHVTYMSKYLFCSFQKKRRCIVAASKGKHCRPRQLQPKYLRLKPV
jgi:hypothetical protein